MRLEAISVGLPTTVDMGSGPETTAIIKTPVFGPVRITEQGLDGDAVGDTKVHGGPDQAAYLYFGADYTHWELLLGRPLPPGVFGDNLTIVGDEHRSASVSSRELWIGDRLSIGPVILEVTAPRIPCGTFARRMDLPKDFIDRFRGELRPGVYTRVIEPGLLSPGDPVHVIEGPRTLSIVELVELWGASPDADTIERVLAAPVAERVRDNYERKLARL
jgi:MOSC domain-containing protein YiiM